jgi:microcystin-dependent protein
MDRKRFTLEIPWPNISPVRLARRLTGWLPTRGNVIFTLAMIVLLIAAQSAGALPLGRAPTAPAAVSTGTIAYQGRLADADGKSLTGTYSMIFRLYNVGANGAPLWEEQWTGSNGVKVSDGLFNVMLGSLTPIPQAVITGHNQLFLGITVGTDDEMIPRVQLGSVPFAVQALTVPDGSMTTAKLANSAITGDKIAAGAITSDKLAPGLNLLPAGTIVMWSGALANIPAGWAVCDGANGTPDLRDRFVLGTGAGENPGETGGANTRSLTANELPSHTHDFTTNTTGNHSHGTHIENDDDFARGSNKGGVDDTSGSAISTTDAGNHNHSGTTNATGAGAAFDIRPKYFKLVFIMKL